MVAQEDDVLEAVLFEALGCDSKIASNAASGTLIVPGKRIWPDGGLMEPSGT